MFQKLGVPENLGPVVLLHDEGPEGAVPSVGDEFVMVHKSLEGVFST